MPCGCNGSAQSEWVVVYADNTVSAAMTKVQATAESHRVSGSWIREAKASASV